MTIRSGRFLQPSCLVLALLLINGLVCQAAPPTITALSAHGAERGKAVEITVSGANLTPTTRFILPFAVTQKTLPEAKPNPAQVRIQLTIDPATTLGVYPLRLATEEGLSALTLFCVDALPGVKEMEDNNSFEKAQRVMPRVVIDGQCAGGDIDFFRFPARKGQRLVIEVEAVRLGASLLPLLRLTDDRKRFLAGDDTQSLQGDARILFTAPADGDYVLELSDTRYRGGTPPFYRLKIADYDVIEEVFPLGGKRGVSTDFTLRGGTLPGELRATRILSPSIFAGRASLGLDGLRPGMTPPRVAVGDLPERLWVKNSGREPRALDVQPPLTVNGRLEKPGDVDRLQFPVQPGQAFRIAVEAESLGSRLDGMLRVIDQTGRLLGQADDSNLPPLAPGLPAVQSADPALELTVPAGATLAVVELRDQRGRGGVNFGYRLHLTPALPDFSLSLGAAELNVPRGGVGLLNVAVTRRGYLGPIGLTLQGLPAGWTAKGGRVAANATAGVFSISAPTTAPAFSVAAITCEGKALADRRESRRAAEAHVLLNRELASSTSSIAVPAIAVASAGPEPFTVEGPETLDIVKGFAATIPIRLTRGKDQAALPIQVTGVDLTLLPGQPTPPGGLVIQPSMPVTAASASFTVTPGANVPVGPLDLPVQGKATVAGAQRSINGKVITVSVLPPFKVVLATPSIELTPGATLQLRGRIERQPVFKEAVQLTVSGLPAGVTLAVAPAPIPSGKSEFDISLKVDAKAAVSGTLMLTATTTIGGVAFPQVPVAVPLTVKK